MTHESADDSGGADVDEAVAALLDDVRSHDWQISWRAADALARLGESAVLRLIKALQDEDGYVREAAASALGKIGDKRAVEPLIAAMRYQDERTYEDSEDEEARVSAARALGEIGEAKAFEPLLQEVSHEDCAMVWAAMEALGKLRNPRAVPQLTQALHVMDVDGKKTAAEALVKIGEPAVLPLIDYIKDERKRGRIFAVMALGRLADARSIDALTELLNDPNEYVRSCAAETIEEIKRTLTKHI